MHKQRDERVKVLATARMRHGNAWSDVCLVDLSVRGAGLQCAVPPSPASYVEIKRGSNVLIVGRVAWCDGQRFGIRTQDVIWVNAVLNDVAVEASPVDAACRRALPRTADDHDHSRLLARRLQFGFVLTGVASFALVLGGIVRHVMAEPLATLSTALAGGSTAAE